MILPQVTFRSAEKLATLSFASLITVGCFAPEDRSWAQPDWDREMIEADRHRPDDLEPPATTEASIVEQLLEEDSAGKIDLSIEQASILALRFNRDLAVEQLNPVIIGSYELVERGDFDPEVFADLEFRQEKASEIDRGTGTRFDVESDRAAGSAGVRQTLPTGTDVELSVSQTRETSNRTPEQQDARLGLTATQQLLRGSGVAVNLVRVRQAEIDTKVSQYELRGFTEALLAEVESTYWRCVLAEQRISIFEQSLAFARQQMRELEQRIELGDLPSIEAAAAKAEIARREQELIDAQSELAATRFRLLRLINPPAFRRGQETHPELNLVSAARINVGPLDDLPERLLLAEQSRPDLAEARLRLEQDRLETIVTRNGLLPRLEVFIALGKTGFDNRFDRSFQKLEQDDSYDFAAGLSVSQPLDNRSARGLNRAAYAIRQQSAAAVENLRQLIGLDVRLAAIELERARQQIDASAVTAELQQQTVAAEEERLNVGAGTALQVAQAQRDLLEANIAEVESIVAYRIALIELYVAEGSLLSRRGIEFD